MKIKMWTRCACQCKKKSTPIIVATVCSNTPNLWRTHMDFACLLMISSNSWMGVCHAEVFQKAFVWCYRLHRDVCLKYLIWGLHSFNMTTQEWLSVSLCCTSNCCNPVLLTHSCQLTTQWYRRLSKCLVKLHRNVSIVSFNGTGRCSWSKLITILSASFYYVSIWPINNGL